MLCIRQFKIIDLENTNAKLYHAKGLTFQAHAEVLANDQDERENEEYMVN